MPQWRACARSELKHSRDCGCMTAYGEAFYVNAMITFDKSRVIRDPTHVIYFVDRVKGSRPKWVTKIKQGIA
jgi:hypothetical protein